MNSKKQKKRILYHKLHSFYGQNFLQWRLRVRQQHKKVAWKSIIALSYGIKRMLDIIVSTLALLFLSPLIIFLSICIVAEDGMPIFFKQERVGENGKLFCMYKLRSMKNNAEKQLQYLKSQNESEDGVIFKMANDPRVTRIGRIIRKMSLDELPQLWNVFIGNMSLVGPRPALPSEVAEYTLEQRERLKIKPGITCFWQVSGRSSLTFTQQVKLDVLYLDSQSFWLDIKLLLKTIPAVILARGAY